jgi:hypothetical protein
MWAMVMDFKEEELVPILLNTLKILWLKITLIN